MSPTPTPYSPAARFRHLYEYERDCNAKVIRMLESIPLENRSSPQFARALGKAAHLVAARHLWLFRLGVCQTRPTDRFPRTPLEELPAATAEVERMWVDFLSRQTDESVMSLVEWARQDGKRERWPLIDLLTQVFGHAWYHRGQIATLVKDLGGAPIESDYISWDRPKIVE